MAMGLLGGLGGLGMSNSYCHMCASHYCMHTVQGMAAQQQMGQQQYDAMVRQYAGSITSASPGTVSVSSGSITSTPTVSPKNVNKKLLLLRR